LEAAAPASPTEAAANAAAAMLVMTKRLIKGPFLSSSSGYHSPCADGTERR